MPTITVDTTFIARNGTTIYLNNLHNLHNFLINVTESVTFNLKSISKPGFKIKVINIFGDGNPVIVFNNDIQSIIGRFTDESRTNIFTTENLDTISATLNIYGIIILESYYDNTTDNIKFIMDSDYSLFDSSGQNLSTLQASGGLVTIGDTLDSNVYVYGNIEVTGNMTIKNVTFEKGATLQPSSFYLNTIQNTFTASGFNYHLTVKDGRVLSAGMNHNGQLGRIGTNRAEYIPNINNIVAVYSGDTSSFVINKNKEVYSFGNNTFSKLGHGGDEDDIKVPTLIPNLNNIISVASGKNYTLFLKDNGSVYSVGDNFYGTLGLGDNEDRINITKIPNFDNIIAISCGNYHSALLTNSGQVYTFGHNNNGELGLGDVINRNVPTLIMGFNNVIQVSCGNQETGLLTNDGLVYTFGRNFAGTLGLGHNFSQISPVNVPGLSDIKKISMNSASLFLKSNGQVFSCGWNAYGQLGDGNIGDEYNKNIPTLIEGFNDVIDISTGSFITCIITSERYIYISGNSGIAQIPGISEHITRHTLLVDDSYNIIQVDKNYNKSISINPLTYGNSLLNLGYVSNTYQNPLTINNKENYRYDSIFNFHQIMFGLDSELSDRHKFSISYDQNNLAFNKLQSGSYIKFNDLSNYTGNSEICIYEGNIGIGNIGFSEGNDTFPRAKLHISQTINPEIDGTWPTYTMGDAIILENVIGKKWNIGLEDDSISHLYFTQTDGTFGGGYLTSAANQAIIDFTGQHKSLANKNIDNSYLGLIVCSNGSYVNLDNSLEPSINESLPVCYIPNTDYDKTVFGVISDKEEDTRTYSSGVWVSIYMKQNNNEYRLVVNSLGEGGIWVCNKNGPLQNGDYITSCSVQGYGMKQTLPEGTLKNYTVAKITCDCNFSLSKIVKQKLLVSNNNIVYSDSGDLQYEDDLDSEGNQQYVYKYETRFLDSQGNLLVDENDYNDRLTNEEEVYIACFVGCTYHCG